MRRLRGGVAPVLVGLALLTAWQALHWMAGADLVSGPGETAALLARLMRTARFWADVGETGLAFAASLALSAVFGVALGVALGLHRATGEVAEPLLVSFYALPKVTLYPLVLLLFGLGLSAKVAFGVMHGLVPIALLTRSAVAQVKPVYWRSAAAMGLGYGAAVRRVVLPAVVPELLAGVRIGFSLSLLGVLIGEMFASKRGLGFAAVNAMGLGDIPTILAIGLFLVVFAVGANLLFLAAERAVRWRSG